MHILQRLLADLRQLRIHFFAGDGALLDADDGASAHAPETGLARTVDDNLVAVMVLTRRTDDRLDGRIGDLADALEHIANLAALWSRWCPYVDMLMLAARAFHVVRAARLHAFRRWRSHAHEVAVA